MNNLFRPFALLLALGCLAPARAQETAALTPARPAGEAPAKAAAPVPKEETAPPVVTSHEITLDGRVVKYTATTGCLPLKDGQGKTTAEIFFVAYTKDGVTDAGKRPVTFSFNGGPGSASIWLHMGAIGPKRVLLAADGLGSLPPPYQMTDNAYSWLDRTDLVFIDPVSTGYSRPAPGVDAKQFHGFQGDIASVADFIRLYLTRYERWTSPKFLVGESYGTTRAAGLSTYLQDRYGIYLNGIMLVSSVMNFQTISFAPGNDLPYALFLPTYAEAAWYHHKLSPELEKETPAQIAARARTFVTEEYEPALFAGGALDAAKKAQVAHDYARLTGLPEDYVLQRDLRVNIYAFSRELLNAENRSIGRYDARLTGIRLHPGTEQWDFDPSFEAVDGGYVACFNDYVRRDLGYKTDEVYEALTGKVQPWDYSNVENRYLDVAAALHEAMSRNTFLKVWVCCGYFDLATPFYATEYTVAHMGLDPAVRGNLHLTYYEAGHMLYMNPASLAQLKQDFTSYMQSTLKADGVTK